MIIIPGLARSGTTYLTDKINNHTPMWITRNNWNEDMIIHNELAGNLKRNHQCDLFDIHFDISDKAKSEFTDFLKTFKKKHPDLGFKDPRGIYFMDSILEVYPEAKYIICIRNYNDWMQSNLRRKVYKGNSLTKNYYYTISLVQKYINRDNVFLWDYDGGENIINQTKLKSFLGLNLYLSDYKVKHYA